jgi:hydrogenase maturation protease
MLVLGLGNPILRDDGVGWRVVEEVRRQWMERHPLSPSGLASEEGPRRWDFVKRTRDEDCFARSGTDDEQASSFPLERIFDVEFDCISLGGLTLMERLVGYERAVLVDAIQTRDGAPGTVYRLTLEDLPTLHADSAHDVPLRAALELGRRLGAKLPADVIIYAIEAANIWDFGETLSPEVDGSVMVAASAVVEELEEEEVWSHPNCCAGTRSSVA